MNSTYKIASITLAAIAATGLAITMPQMDASAQVFDENGKKTIKIGTLLTDSGAHQDRLKAMNIAMNDFNNVNEDYVLELVSYQINPNGEGSGPHADSRTGTQINKAFTEDNITYFVGPMGSTDTRSAKAQLEEVLMPANTDTDFVVISPASTDPRLRVDDNVFRMVIDDSQQSVVLADRMNSEGKMHVVMIGLNNSQNHNERDGWSEGLEIQFVNNFNNDVSYHFTLVRGLDSTNAAYDRLASDLDEAVSGLVSQHGADKVAVVAMVYAPDISKIIQAINGNTALDSVDDVQWYGPDGIAFRDEVTKDNHHVGRFLANVGFVASQYAGTTNEVREDVKSRLASTGVTSTSSIYLYSSYDAVRLLANAIAERDLGNDVKTVKQMLLELADDSVGTGALGDYGFNEQGDLDEPFVFRFGIVTLDQNGAPVWQVEMPEPKICR